MYTDFEGANPPKPLPTITMTQDWLKMDGPGGDYKAYPMFNPEIRDAMIDQFAADLKKVYT